MGSRNSTNKAPESRATDYLQTLGIGKEKPWGTFWSRLKKAHGPIAQELMEAINDRVKSGSQVYELKNRTLQLSLDMTSQYWGNLYRSYLSWLLTQDVPEPSRVLDLGCDNGVLTCFYAIHFPKAKVVGIDRCSGAISCARELVNRLHLDNVEFEQMDIQHAVTTFGEGSFDLAFATCSLKEVQPFPEVQTFSSFDFSGADPSSNYVARAVSGALSPTMGSFVSMERCGGLGDLAWWVRSLNGAGLSLDWEHSTLISFQADGTNETLPVLVARNARPVRISPKEDILAFRASQQFIELHPVYEGFAAEAFFRALNPKQLVRGAEIVFRNGGGTERFEIWTADSLLITYQYSTRGFRRFAAGSKVFLSSGISMLEQYAEEKAPYADVHLYEALEGTPSKHATNCGS